MSFLIVTCLVCALPSLLPIIRIVNKKELNMFDFIVFYMIFFKFKILGKSLVEFRPFEKCANL